MFVNIGSREFLTPFEIALLVNGIIAAIAEDRYVEITIQGRKSALNQFALITRLGGRGIGYDDYDIVRLVAS